MRVEGCKADGEEGATSWWGAVGSQEAVGGGDDDEGLVRRKREGSKRMTRVKDRRRKVGWGREGA